MGDGQGGPLRLAQELASNRGQRLLRHLRVPGVSNCRSGVCGGQGSRLQYQVRSVWIGGWVGGWGIERPGPSPRTVVPHVLCILSLLIPSRYGYGFPPLPFSLADVLPYEVPVQW